MKNKVTRNDVAKRAGVSTAVVSYVINNGPRPTSKQTREKVMAAIAELGYRVNNVARSLTSKTSRVIGLLIPNNANAFFSEVAQGVEDMAFSHGYRVILCNTHGDQERLDENINALISQMVDGVIMITTPFSEHRIALLEEYDIPVVLVDPEKNKSTEIDLPVGLVTVNGIQGGRLAANHLLECGHHEIAIITDSLEISPSAERVEGFLEVLREAGLQPQVVTIGDKLADGYQAAGQLLASSKPPTAIFTCNDMLAIGVIRCANDRSISIPGELAVIGYDDIEFASFITPRLTTIRQPKYQMGEVATKLMLQRIEAQKTAPGKNAGEALPERIVMQVELIVRETTQVNL